LSHRSASGKQPWPPRMLSGEVRIENHVASLALPVAKNCAEYHGDSGQDQNCLSEESAVRQKFHQCNEGHGRKREKGV